MKEWKILDNRGKVVSSAAKKRAEIMASYYLGADTGRVLGDWSTPRTTADTALRNDRRYLVDRTYERSRNDPIFGGMLRRMLDCVIGTGIRYESDLDASSLGLSEDQAREFESNINFQWGLWGRECDYSGNESRSMNIYEMQRAILRSEMVSGENFILPRYVNRPWANYNLCIQAIEPERVSTPPLSGISSGLTYWEDVKLANGNKIRDGIELDKTGAIAAIHVCDEYPANSLSLTGDPKKWRRIPTYNRLGLVNFWHVFPFFRLGATRGEPAFAACLSGLRQIGDYLSFELTRAEMAAMFGLILTSDDHYGDGLDISDTTRKKGNEDEQDFEQVELFPGMVYRAPKGFAAQTVNPNIPGDNFDSFVERVVTFLGGPVGLVREIVTGSFDKSNFSNTRAALQLMERGSEAVRSRIIGKYMDPIYRRFLNEAVLRRKLVLPGWENPEKRELWCGRTAFAPPWPWPEPIKDEQAAALRLETTGTIRDLATQRGQNWRKTITQQTREKAFRQQEEKRLGYDSGRNQDNGE